MLTVFSQIPPEIGLKFILIHLNRVQRLFLRQVLLFEPIPLEISGSLQEEVHAEPVNVFQWFYQRNLIDVSSIRSRAVTHGNLPLLKWSYQEGLSDINYALGTIAIKHHQLEIMKFLIEQGDVCLARDLQRAVESGNLEMVKLVYRSINKGDLFDPTLWAAESGHLEILQWFQNNGYSHRDEFIMAVRGGHLNIVEYLYSDLPGSSHHRVIAFSGKLDLIQWLYQRRPELRDPLIRCARARRHHDVADWLEQN